MFEIGILDKQLYNWRPCTICGIRRYPENTLEIMAMHEAGSSAHGFPGLGEVEEIKKEETEQ